MKPFKHKHIDPYTTIITSRETKEVRVLNVVKHPNPPKVEAFDHKAFLSRTDITLGAEADLRVLMPPIVDQGNIGSCVSNATCSLLSYNYRLSFGPLPIYSRLYNYFNARGIESRAFNDPSYLIQDTGLYVLDGTISARTYGSVDETIWPYNTSKFNLLPVGEAYNVNFLTRNIRYNEIAQTAVAIQTALQFLRPIIFGIMLYSNFPGIGSDGIVPMPAGSLYGGHCMLIVGYYQDTRYFICRNSWGRNWGDRGYCYIPYDYILNPTLCFDFYTVRYG